jgi:hypothetical protein
MTDSRRLAVDVEDIIRAHQPDDEDGRCVACKAEGYAETYPCWPLLLADRLAERKARRADAAGGEQAEGAP